MVGTYFDCEFDTSTLPKREREERALELLRSSNLWADAVQAAGLTGSPGTYFFLLAFLHHERLHGSINKNAYIILVGFGTNPTSCFSNVQFSLPRVPYMLV